MQLHTHKAVNYRWNFSVHASLSDISVALFGTQLGVILYKSLEMIISRI